MGAGVGNFGPLCGFDTETTGVSVFNDRIVTAAIIKRGGDSPGEHKWLLDPGVEIPEGAAKIHGITTDFARAHGMTAREGLIQIAQAISDAVDAGYRLVAFNASFDISILEYELARHSIPTLTDRFGEELFPIIDPLVMDRGLDRWRKGKRNLESMAKHYGASSDKGLHTAEVDVALTLDVLEKIGAAYPDVVAWSYRDLHDWQQSKHREWAQSFNEWLSRQNPTREGAHLEWPLLKPKN